MSVWVWFLVAVLAIPAVLMIALHGLVGDPANRWRATGRAFRQLRNRARLNRKEK